MKNIALILYLFVCSLFVISCQSAPASKEKEEPRKTVEMITDFGTIQIELYNETPLHRDNFIKLVEEKAYDSLLFHRVIHEFMIQGGDPESKYANPGDTLGNGDRDYTVPAELVPTLFHKKGVLAAARTNNPERASSSMQFYLVQGKVLNDSLLDVAEKRINAWLADHYTRIDTSNKPLVDSLTKAIETANKEMYYFYDDSLKSLAESYEFEKYIIPEEHRVVYKTIGGTPHLDQNYTVYGEVVSGLEVIDSIAAVETGVFNRPINDVRIIKVRMLENNPE